MSPSERVVRCAIYTRVSVADAGADPALSSCALQYAACAKYIEHQRGEGWALPAERFDDDGWSGADTDRPALDRLLTRVLAGQIDCIVVLRLDRLTRSLMDWVRLSHAFAQRNVILHLVLDNKRAGGTAISRFQLDLLATFAEFEREVIIERLRDAHAAYRARGQRSAGAVPFGYEADARTKQLVPDERRGGVVVWMFELADAGVPPSDIATRANRRRVRTTRGAKWTPRSILKLLRHEVYMGLRTPDIVGVHRSLVERDLFERVQGVLNARQTRKPSSRDRDNKGADPFILRGLVRCNRCLKPMTTTTSGTAWRRTGPRRQTRVGVRFYRCRRQGCAGSRVAAELLESKVVDLIRSPPRDVQDYVFERLVIAASIWDALFLQNRGRYCRSIFDAILWDGRTGRVKPTWFAPREPPDDE